MHLSVELLQYTLSLRNAVRFIKVYHIRTRTIIMSTVVVTMIEGRMTMTTVYYPSVRWGGSSILYISESSVHRLTVRFARVNDIVST